MHVYLLCSNLNYLVPDNLRSTLIALYSLYALHDPYKRRYYPILPIKTPYL